MNKAMTTSMSKPITTSMMKQKSAFKPKQQVLAKEIFNPQITKFREERTIPL